MHKNTHSVYLLVIMAGALILLAPQVGYPVEFGSELPVSNWGTTPCAAVDDLGYLHVVWVDYTLGLHYKKFNLNGWDGYEDLDAEEIPEMVPGGSAVDSRFAPPAIAVDKQGNPHIVWGGYKMPEVGPIYYITYQDGAWGDPEVAVWGWWDWVSFPDIGIDHNTGKIWVVAEEVTFFPAGSNNRIVLKYKDPESGQWLPNETYEWSPYYLSDPEAKDPRKCSLAVNKFGDVFVTWRQAVDGVHNEIHMKEVTAEGEFKDIVIPVRYGLWAAGAYIESDENGYPRFANAVFDDEFWVGLVNYSRWDGNEWINNGLPIPGEISTDSDNVFVKMALNEPWVCIAYTNDRHFFYYLSNHDDEEYLWEEFPYEGDSQQKGRPFPVGYDDGFIFFWDDTRGYLYMRAMMLGIGKRKPLIRAAGYGDTRLSTCEGGMLVLNAAIDDQVEQDNLIASVEMMYNHIPMDIYLRDDGLGGDRAGQDDVYSIQLPIIPGAPAGDYLIELITFTDNGQASSIWPYLTVWGDEQQGANESAPYTIPPITPWYAMENELINQPPAAPEEKGYSRYDSTAPIIDMAGYEDTYITNRDGGLITMRAYVKAGNYNAQDISVEVYYQGMPTGIMLNYVGVDNTYTNGDYVYENSTEIIPGIPPGEYLLELVATNPQGEKSITWPYARVFYTLK